MLSKVLAVVQSKVALAAIGVALVGGGGTAAAYVATGHQLPLLGTHATATEKPDATHEADDNHAHTLSIEGVLKSYNGSTITVLSADGAKPEATEKPDATHAAAATEKPEATDTTHAAEATKTPTTVTITVNAKTRINGDHASTLADLAKNIGHKVEVQADKQSNGSLVAWKVTVSGADSQSGDTSGKGDSKGDSSSSQNSQTHELQGTVTSVGSGSFVLKLADGSTKTVTTNAQTQFKGSVHSLADLKASTRVVVQGTTQSNGTVLASSVEAASN